MTASLSSTSLIGPEATASEQSRMELQARLNGLGGMNGRNLPPEAKAKKLREACEGFESIFIQKMWQEMRNAVPRTGILSGREERFWQDMYDQELSKSMTKAGGIGLADMMYEQLSRNLVSASRGAAASVQGAAFMPSAAPLVTAEAEDMLAPAKPAPAASIYESEAPEARTAAESALVAAQANNTAAQHAVAQAGQAAQAPKAQANNAAQAVAQAAQAPIAGHAPSPAQTHPVEVHYSPAKNTAHDTPHHKAADLNQASGILMAQQAFRDAGDKLGARAVRPASRSRWQREERRQMEVAARQAQAVQQASQPVPGISQNGLAPGSPEALLAAMEKARAGYAEQDQAQTAINLHNLVANAQARNVMPHPAQPQAPAEPVVKRVRKTSNIPQNNNNRQVKRNSQAIRMLNVDNVGVNSRQGQGLAAYHAQQAAAEAQARDAGRASQAQAANMPTAPIAPLAASSAQAPQAVPPLTAKSQMEATHEPTGNFAIPPLTAPSRG